MAEGVKPGWYPHPSMADTQRYWDGVQWTDHIAPGTPGAATAADHQAGQTLTLVGLGLAVVFPAAGLVVGFMLLAKREVKAGVVVLLLSVGMAYFWLDKLAGN